MFARYTILFFFGLLYASAWWSAVTWAHDLPGLWAPPVVLTIALAIIAGVTIERRWDDGR
jgi:hypothetical protein